MKKKIIGIAPRYVDLGNQYAVRVGLTYINKLNREDILPIIIVNTMNLEEVLNMCDAFLIIGGDDINPNNYHENNDLCFSHDVIDEVDEIDKAIINHAIKYNKPALGICRGIQVMAAFLGGSLHQDLNYDHVYHPVVKDKVHEVTKVTNYGLATLLPDTYLVNTFHHQAVKKVPDDFVVLYKNGETIEAIESTTHPLVGVQWHPERYPSKESDIIFNYFFNLIK